MKTILQMICVVSISFGIVIEALYGADIGFILITTGSLSFGISTKIHNRVHKDDLEIKNKITKELKREEG